MAASSPVRPGSGARRILFRLLVGLVVLLPAQSALPAPTREEVEAALVYKFAQFVQWSSPAREPGSPIVIGVLGKDPVLPVLEATLLKKRLNGSPVEVRACGSPEEAQGCSIVVVKVPESRRELVLSKLPSRGVLTIGEGAAFARQGGVIALLLDAPRVEFDVNLAAAERAGLTIDAALLGLAREAGRW